MQKYLAIVFALLCVSGGVDGQSGILRLHEVKTIYVSRLSGQDAATADLISAKLISYLAKQTSISVVEVPDSADAILAGTAQIQTTQGANGQTSVHLQAAMRLVSKGGVVLWGDDVSSSPFAPSASSSFAENVSNRLVKAILLDGELR